MKPISKLAVVTAAGAVAAALSALPASASTARAWPGQAPAVFVQIDNTAGNTIVAYQRTVGGGTLYASNAGSGTESTARLPHPSFPSNCTARSLPTSKSIRCSNPCQPPPPR